MIEILCKCAPLQGTTIPVNNLFYNYYLYTLINNSKVKMLIYFILTSFYLLLMMLIYFILTSLVNPVYISLWISRYIKLHTLFSAFT